MILRLIALVLASPAVVLGVDPDILGYEGEARKVIDRALAQYRTAKSYQDKCVIKVEVDAEGKDSGLLPEEFAEVRLARAGANRVALAGPEYGVFCDGTTLWEHVGVLDQYIEVQAPAKFDPASLALAGTLIYNQAKHPLAAVVGLEGSGVNELFGKVVLLTGVKAETIGGQRGKLLGGEVEENDQTGASSKVPFEAWFADQTGLLGEIRYDQTEVVKALLSKMGVTESQIRLKKRIRRLRFEEVSLNKEVAAKRFVFKPSPYDEKKERFQPPTNQEAWQRQLVGRPAQDFSGKDMDGKPLKLADLKGRVVLLDFWASYCRPCLIAMPGIQKLSEQYADKPVSVIGVNLDGPADRETVQRILKQTKVTYRQLVDTGGTVSAAYRVSPIPCIVVIGKKGMVQAIHAGFSWGQDRMLAQEFDKLLKGENLFSTSRPAS